MRIRIFRAPTLAAAMAQVRSELGLDALILGTRSEDGLVHVTAALEPEDEPDLPVSSRMELQPDPVIEMHPGDGLGRHGLPPFLLTALRKAPLETSCSRLFRFTRLPLDADAPPLLLAGPPGAGKTLTIAKLAARLVMEGHRPLVITADEQRAGAVEQLAAFTRLLGLTLIAAGRPDMIERALSRREPLSPVLIDAPGLDLLDPVQEELLVGLVAASRARIGLVLPAGLDPAEAAEIAVAHARIGAGLLVATRLDRNGRLGGLLAAAHEADLALTEAGIGSGIADGLTRFTPALIAARFGAIAPDRSVTQTAPAPSVFVQAPLRAIRDEPIGSALALHIAAQAGTSRLPQWKTNP